MAQASLNKTLTGAREEDIQIYRTRVADAEVGLAVKKQGLVDTKEDADNNLAQDHKDMVGVLDEAVIKTDDALNKQIDQLFDDDSINPDLAFNVSNSQIEIDVERDRLVCASRLEQMEDEINLLFAADYNVVDTVAVNAQSDLIFIRNFFNIF